MSADRIAALTAENERLHERILELTTLTGRDKLTAELEAAKAERDHREQVSLSLAEELAAMTKELEAANQLVEKLRVYNSMQDADAFKGLMADLAAMTKERDAAMRKELAAANARVAWLQEALQSVGALAEQSLNADAKGEPE